jgi:predicted CXXCH cytochrome family protein
LKIPRFKTPTLITIIGSVGLVVLAISCATVKRVVVAPPMIPGATYVGMDACSACHEKIVANFKNTSHGRMTIEGEGERVEGQGCEGCHGPGSLHVDAGGGKGKFIINPGKDPESCYRCHLDKKAEFNLTFHHPVKEGKMNCLSCHNPHGDAAKPPGMTVSRGVNDTCAQCHREQAKPFVFTHEALREGCTECHTPHGSINPKLLTARDNNLCLKCHAQVASQPGTVVIGKMPHAGFGSNNFLQRGTCFSAGCHTAVHGSNINPHLRY